MTRGRMSHVEGVIYTQFEPRTRTVNSVPAIPLGFCLLPRPTRNAPPLTRLKSASTEDGAGQPGHNLRLTFHLMLICVFLSLTRPHARARGAWAEMLRLDERRAQGELLTRAEADVFSCQHSTLLISRRWLRCGVVSRVGSN